MRSGRAVVGVSSDLLNLSPPHSYSQSQSDLSLNHISSQSVQHPQIVSTLKSNVTDDDEDSGQEWGLDRNIGSSNRYSEFLDDFQHSKSCEKSKHYRQVQRKRRLEEQVSDTNNQNPYTVNERKSLLCFKNRTNTRQRSSLDGQRHPGCCHCNKGQNTQSHEGGESVTLKELSNESEYFDYYYIQQPIEDDLDKRFSRRASDFELQKEGHSQSLPFLLSRSQSKEKRSRHRKRSFRSVTEGQRLTRSLEELPGDIKEHILQCKCSCDHLGYGNYSTLSLRDISGPSWKTSSMESKTGAPQTEDKKEPLIKYKQKDLEIRYHILGVICLVLVLAGVAGVGVSVPLALKTTPTPSAAPVEDRLGAAKTLLSETPLVDGHNDLPWNIRKFMHNRLHSFNMSADLSTLRPWSRSSWSHTDIPRLRRGHVGAQFWVSYVPCESQYMNAVQLTIEQIDLIKRLVDQYPNDLRLATSSDDIESSFREGRIASLIGVEGGHAIQNSLGVLRSLYDLGVRYMTLTHTCSTPWAECARNSESDLEDPNSPRGLTHFGKTVVREMNRLGIVVDLSHVSQATMREALQVSRSPVLFSHSSVYAICKNPRNVPDDILRKVKSNGGLVMVSFYNHFLTCSEHATVKNVIDHINHVRKIAGVDHVGIGADFDGVNKLPTGLEDVSKYPNLFAELMNDPTWSEEDLKKLAGLNLLRVLREVEKGAKELKMQRVGPYEEDVPYSQIKVKNDCTYRFLKDDRS